jgi:hypothetical protein
MTKRLLLLSLLCSVGVLTGRGADAVERAETLQAINWVENPTNHTRRGSKGELGPYQFRAQTWRMHTRRSFDQAVVRAHADEVAVRHYEWIRRELRGSGIDPSAYNIALAWNSGLGAVLRGEVPTVSYHYAERVANLVERQRLERVARSAPPAAVAQAVSRYDLSRPSGLHFRSGPAPRFDLLPPSPAADPVVRTVAAVAPVRADAPSGRAALGTPGFALIR